MDKKTFVEEKLSEVVSIATGWVDHLEYIEDGYDETVIIVCGNGYRYNVNVSADSESAIVYDVIKEIQRH